MTVTCNVPAQEIMPFAAYDWLKAWLKRIAWAPQTQAPVCKLFCDMHIYEKTVPLHNIMFVPHKDNCNKLVLICWIRNHDAAIKAYQLTHEHRSSCQHMLGRAWPKSPRQKSLIKTLSCTEQIWQLFGTEWIHWLLSHVAGVSSCVTSAAACCCPFFFFAKTLQST